MGDVVNEGRRLQAQAEPAAVVVDEATYAATRSVVQYQPHSAGTFAVADVAPVKQARPHGLAAFIGRDTELDLLLGVWRRTVSERRPHLVSILGEPGVGKSRQLAGFQRLVVTQSRVVGGRCLPYGDALSYARWRRRPGGCRSHGA